MIAPALRAAWDASNVVAGHLRPVAALAMGSVMRRVFLAVLAASALTGCGSVSIPGLGGLGAGSARPTTIQLESNPQGAEAQTSTGQSCRTPCALTVPAEAMTVTFALDRHQQQTVSLQPVRKQITDFDPESSGVDYVTALEPSPVYAELAPTAPPRKKRPAKRPAKQAASSAEPTASTSTSPFPDPTQSQPRFPSR